MSTDLIAARIAKLLESYKLQNRKLEIEFHAKVAEFEKKLSAIEKKSSPVQTADDLAELKHSLNKLLDITVVLGHEVADLKAELKALKVNQPKTVLEKKKISEKVFKSKIAENLDETEIKSKNLSSNSTEAKDFFDLSPQLQEIILNVKQGHKYSYEEFQQQFELSNNNARKILSILRSNGWIKLESDERPKFFVFKSKEKGE